MLHQRAVDSLRQVGPMSLLFVCCLYHRTHTWPQRTTAAWPAWHSRRWHCCPCISFLNDAIGSCLAGLWNGWDYLLFRLAPQQILWTRAARACWLRAKGKAQRKKNSRRGVNSTAGLSCLTNRVAVADISQG